MYSSVVYVDKLFLGNLLVNGLLLWSAGRLSQIKVKYHRLIIASCLGSLYSLAYFLPGLEFLFSVFGKVLMSLVMAAAAFAPLPPRKFALCLCFFYLVSFATGGMVIGFAYLAGHTGGIAQIENFLLIVNRYLGPGLCLALTVLWAAVAALPRYFKGRQRIEAFRLPVTIYLEGRAVVVRGLVDTGNSLCDPVSGEPVVVVEHNAIRDVLPEPMREPGTCTGDAITAIEKMAGTPWSGRLRLIPFNSLGNDRGILLGIKPDKVEFLRDKKVQRVDKVVIGIHGRSFDAGEEYNAIINPSLLDRAIPA